MLMCNDNGYRSEKVPIQLLTLKCAKQLSMSKPMEAEPNPIVPQVTNPTQNSTATRKSIQTGIERYIKISEKRKLSPQSSSTGRTTKQAKEDNTRNDNYYSILATEEKDSVTNVSSDPEKNSKPKPPPIFIRGVNSAALIKDLVNLLGANTFYAVDLRKGNIKETKIQTSEEVKYCQAVNWLENSKINFYSYQLKSARGLVVIIKGIDPEVEKNEIKEELESKGFATKAIHNVINKDKVPQPMFKVELVPQCSKPPKGKTHPIYNIQYLLHRRVTVEEPQKRYAALQCHNCQEFGHSKNYCRLTSVCVVCGDLHPTESCTKNKTDLTHRKCSNCNGNHTANYRGCPVYNAIYKRKDHTKPACPSTSQSHKTSTDRVVPAATPVQAQEFHPHMQGAFESYAAAARYQQNEPHTGNQMHSSNHQDAIMQVLLTLTNNIQQLTQIVNQMQINLSKQTELLNKLINK